MNLHHSVKAGFVAGILGLLLTTSSIFAETPTALRLWDQAAPGALGNEDKDIPTITPYLPEEGKGTGAAVVILPGGGYGGLAPYEGEGYAVWLKEHGIAGLVVKYRLGSQGYRHPIMLQDASRAVRFARSKAGEWKLDPKRIGIMGSSAGGHLASTVVTHFDDGKPDAADPVDRFSSRPDLGILCYPVITMGDDTHKGSRANLLGDKPSQELIDYLSNEKQVKTNTPPCFVWHTWEDSAVKVENSLEFAAALRRQGVPFDLHIYQKGPHGMGLGQNHPWNQDLLFWFKVQGFVK